jgi:hypothetical protein
MSEHTISLPDFSEVVPKSAADDACFEEVREVLRKHGALSRFGVCLLHEHFAVSGEEILIEHVDSEARTMTLRPVKKSEVSGNVLETAWRLDIGEPTQRCIYHCEWDDDPDGVRRHRRTHHWSL